MLISIPFTFVLDLIVKGPPSFTYLRFAGIVTVSRLEAVLAQSRLVTANDDSIGRAVKAFKETVCLAPFGPKKINHRPAPV